MAATRCLSDFRCSVVVCARHVAPESDSLLRFGALQLAMTVIHRERERKNPTTVSSLPGNLDESGQRRHAARTNSSEQTHAK